MRVFSPRLKVSIELNDDLFANNADSKVQILLQSNLGKLRGNKDG